MSYEQFEFQGQEMDQDEEFISQTFSFPEENDEIDFNKVYGFKNLGYRLRKTPFAFATPANLSFILQDNSLELQDRSNLIR
eukprot:jgi/Orpsp1_1/1184836/evm.model.c7180000091190.1